MGNNKVIKAGVWFIICNFLVKGLTFITMPLFTRLMTSNDIGNFSNITSWFNILVIVTTFEIYSSVSIARFDFKEKLNDYISSSLVLGTIITAIFYILVIIFNEFFTNLFCIDFITLNIIFIYLLFYPSVQMYIIKNQINYDYKNVIKLTLINSLFSIAFSVICVIFFHNKLLGRIIGYFFPLTIVAIIMYINILVKSKKISKKYWKYALKISFPLIWHLLAGHLLSSSDRIMITKLISADANALYSVSYTLSMIVSILWSSLNNAWSPWAYEQMDKKRYNNLYNKSKPYTIFFLVLVYMFMFVTPELLFIMGGKYYIQAKYVIPPVMIGYVFQFIYSLYVNIEFYHKKQRNIAFGTIIAAGINIILNLIFIPKFGYIAAAYTTLIGYFSLLVIHFSLVKKMNCTSWYDTKFFIIVSIVSIISIFVFNILYTFNIARYILIIVLFIIFLIFCIRKKAEIIAALKSKSLNNIVKIFYKNY